MTRAMESNRLRLMQAQQEEEQDAASPMYDVASMPGFRFQPTEEELVGFYLRSMVVGNRLEVELINVLDLYRYDPWELPAMAFMQGEREWLFFCPRDRKYPNGARPNRVTASGYWKATGTDRQVRCSHDAQCIGLKKTLVFYTGRAPHGRKTEWIMNEYRIPQPEQIVRNSYIRKDPREVALCRIYKKTVSNAAQCTHGPDSTTEDGAGVDSPAHNAHTEGSNHAPDSEQASASTSGTSPNSRFTSCRRSIFHDDTDLQVKHETTIAELRANLAPDNEEDTFAALLNAHAQQSRRGRAVSDDSDPSESSSWATTSSDADRVSVSVSADHRFSWFRQDASLPGEVDDLLAQAGNLGHIASIDRLLKTSMFSPSATHSLLADENNVEVEVPLPTSLFSSHFGATWSSHQPAWLQSISPGRQTL